MAEADEGSEARSPQGAPGKPQHTEDHLPELPQQCATPQLMAAAAATAVDCSALVLGEPQGFAPAQVSRGTLPLSSQDTPLAARRAALAKLRARANGRTGGTSIEGSMVAPLLEPPPCAATPPSSQPAPWALLPPQPSQRPPASVPHEQAASVPLGSLTESSWASGDQATALAAAASHGAAVAEPEKVQRRGRRWSILPRLRMARETDGDLPQLHPAAAAMQEAAVAHQTASPEQRAASPVKPWMHKVFERFSGGGEQDSLHASTPVCLCSTLGYHLLSK